MVSLCRRSGKIAPRLAREKLSHDPAAFFAGGDTEYNGNAVGELLNYYMSRYAL
jgi:hypothetical protein